MLTTFDFACCRSHDPIIRVNDLRGEQGELLLLEFGEQQRFLAGLAEVREMALQAGLDRPASGFDAGTFSAVVRRTSLRDCRGADERVLARRGKLREVILDARGDA